MKDLDAIEDSVCKLGKERPGIAFSPGLDRHMWKMILNYLPKEKAREQLQELENIPTYTICIMPEKIRKLENAEPKIVGLDNIEIDEIRLEENKLKENTLYIKKIPQRQMDDITTYTLHYSVKTVDGKIKEGIISEAELSFSIEENTLNNLLPAILKVKTKRKHTVGHGPHFDQKLLLEAYLAYIAQFDALMVAQRLNYYLLDKPWLAIGKQQRLLPVAVLNEFSRSDRSFCVGENNIPPAFDDKVMPRESRWFIDFHASSGLGFDFTLFRAASDMGLSPRESAFVAGAGGRVARRDFAAVGRLYEVRNAELFQLRRELNLVAAPGP